MACFLVPTAEAVVTKIVEKAERTKEQKAQIAPEVSMESALNNSAVTGAEFDSADAGAETEVRSPLSQKLRWLNRLLLGGAVLLMFEHVWHGEVVAWFPFLTNAANPADAAVMLHEMATVGVAMAALVTGIWAVMCMVADSLARKETRARKLAAEETI